MKRVVVITSKLNLMTGEKFPAYSKYEKERLEEEWLSKRLDTFMKFTAQCLINQSDQRFVAIYAYADDTEKYIVDILSRYAKLPDNIRFVKVTEYINELNKITEGYDMLLLSRLDTDDLYRYDFVERLMEYEINEDLEEILCQRGYIYDSINNNLAEYYHKQFTFYTFIYRLGEGDKKYSSLDIEPMELLLDFSHFRTMNYKYEPLEGRNFIFVIHNENSDSKFGNYNNGFNRVERFIESKKEITDILYDFL